jgi:2-polyprenyl-6-methoxyphenol hydroxylase-like FAD-dependent oxidoreductase
MSLGGKHVAVVGAGIGGAATALLAARAGARVTLLERDATPRTARAGILLHPNALAVLYGLDLDERLARCGTRVTALRVADAAGRTILDVPVPSFGAGLDHALVVRRSDLLAALLDLLAAERGVECVFGSEVVGATADGEVTYRSRGARRTLVADAVVGADGAHSAVRRQSGIAARAVRGLRYVRGIGAELPLAGLTEFWTEHGIFGVAPLPHGTYFYASAAAAVLADALAARDVARFADRWASALPIAAEVLAGVAFDDLVVTEAVRVDADAWTTGRIVLVGDAAHAMAPNLGQGAGSALADAAVLVSELARADDTRTALARYEVRRRPVVRPVQDIADWLGWLSDLTPATVRELRDGAVHLLGRWLLGEVGMRLVEQQDPVWLRLAAENPTEALDLEGRPL